MAKRKSSRSRSASPARRRADGTRELITPNGDARYSRRSKTGRITESVDVGKSLRADRRKKSSKKVRSGYGDRGDRPSR